MIEEQYRNNSQIIGRYLCYYPPPEGSAHGTKGVLVTLPFLRRVGSYQFRHLNPNPFDKETMPYYVYELQNFLTKSLKN